MQVVLPVCFNITNFFNYVSANPSSSYNEELDEVAKLVISSSDKICLIGDGPDEDFYKNWFADSTPNNGTVIDEECEEADVDQYDCVSSYKITKEFIKSIKKADERFFVKVGPNCDSFADLMIIVMLNLKKIKNKNGDSLHKVLSSDGDNIIFNGILYKYKNIWFYSCDS